MDSGSQARVDKKTGRACEPTVEGAAPTVLADTRPALILVHPAHEKSPEEAEREHDGERAAAPGIGVVRVVLVDPVHGFF